LATPLQVPPRRSGNATANHLVLKAPPQLAIVAALTDVLMVGGARIPRLETARDEGVRGFDVGVLTSRVSGGGGDWLYHDDVAFAFAKTPTAALEMQRRWRVGGGVSKLAVPRQRGAAGASWIRQVLDAHLGELLHWCKEEMQRAAASSSTDSALREAARRLLLNGEELLSQFCLGPGSPFTHLRMNSFTDCALQARTSTREFIFLLRVYFYFSLR
jgi:hypothetical protein